jgi:hypothetical protein
MQKILRSFPYVETYIEVIAGFLDSNGKPIGIFDISKPLISLARYDMKIVPSLAQQTQNGMAYTDKQAALATALVLKYEKQLLKHGISVEPVRDPQYRLPIRTIDRSRKMSIVDDKIVLQFPFIVDLVEQIREYAKISKGRVEFDHPNKRYSCELNENNLNWLYTFAKQNNFEIAGQVNQLMKTIFQIENQGFEICLKNNDNQLAISNADASLTEYIETCLGGFGQNNVLRLIDNSPVLGYTINKDICTQVINQHGHRFWTLCNNKILKVDPVSGIELLADIIMYANLVNRLPIYVYEPDLSSRILKKISQTVPNELIYHTEKDHVLSENTQVVYSTRLPKTENRIPLLITGAGMLFGANKTSLIQAAEKVVYFSQDVYNKNTKGADICRLD